MRTYVSTLGFDETRVTRPVLRNGLEDGDVVRLLRPATEREDDRATAAVDHTRGTLQEITPGATVAVDRIDTADVPDAVQQCGAVIDDADGSVIVNFGGGAREVFLPLSMAAAMYAHRIEQAFQYTDIDQQVTEIDLPHLTATVPGHTRPTLRALARADRQLSISELARKTEHDSSTIARHVDVLEDSGLVTTQSSGRAKYVDVTPTGWLLSKATHG
ncbi:CRISPR-associated CARF protein Csa3 [Halopiger goleimassiliensis]|uniref:CRISPR-associated CARF protein Csa3 n=1 Tax=Halopiger goleimassiliensis TaxID=1293048 RepID=UPI000677FC25|nr:CRISPR-associated CARF protein Csa3 [Halopiger goleimassiliensis]